MGRTIIVGDVHGCREELESLLEYVGFGEKDALVMVGDLAVRGPDPHGTLALLRKLGARAVRGNHEDRLLRYRASLATDQKMQIGSMTRKTVEALTTKDWEYLERLPLWLDLPEHDVRVVHAGVVPGIPIDEQDPRALMYIRSLAPSPKGPPQAHEERGIQSWAHTYEGQPHIVFGHNAQIAPEIAEHATGIDTGAVYGGRLTAMVLRRASSGDGERGEEVPPRAERESVLVSVPARRAYVTRSARAA
jgi:hypothetical protein